MSSSEFGWSDLQADLLCDLMRRLEVDDFIRARAVCSWWNSTPKKAIDCRPKPQLPWLMLSSPSNPDSRYFYRLNSGEQQQPDEENKKKKKKKYHHEIRLPGIAGQPCIGSSEGFVFTVDRFGEIHALNPLTGARLPLPSIATQPNMIAVARDSSGKPTEYIYLNTYTCPESTYAFDLDSMHGFYTKAIVAPSSRTVIVIHAGLFEALSFARPGDTSWSALPSPTQGATDIIFHKGLLHAIDFYGTLAAFDIDGDNDDPLHPLFLSPPGPLMAEGGECRRFLVESPDSQDLFLVLKEHNGDYVKPRTKTCQVFKLDRTSLQWNRVQSMGECALFLGFNSSVSFSTYEFTNLKKGDIYFTDDYREVYFNNPDAVGDTGVFNLEDGTVRPLGSDLDLQKLNWPPPIWFAPML